MPDTTRHRLDAADIDRAHAVSIASVAIERGFLQKRFGCELDRAAIFAAAADGCADRVVACRAARALGDEP
jgi:hypothetical protein